MHEAVQRRAVQRAQATDARRRQQVTSLPSCCGRSRHQGPCRGMMPARAARFDMRLGPPQTSIRSGGDRNTIARHRSSSTSAGFATHNAYSETAAAGRVRRSPAPAEDGNYVF
jgi:hypothetical protein